MFHGRDVELWGHPKMGRVRTVSGRIDVEAELLQYTGLKDKNGKEIYDNDILYCSKVYYKLKRHISGAYELYEILKDGKYSCKPYFLFHEIDKVEIIGNIYENPELLEG